MTPALKRYLRDINFLWASGQATEHSYRPALKSFVEALDTTVSATNEPKRVACGAPDFIVTRDSLPIGCIECKDIGMPLDEAEKSEQLGRYLDSIEHLILTNYLEFRYYIGGEMQMHVLLARPDSAKNKIKALQWTDEQLASLFANFMAARGATIYTPADLAARMANVAKVIYDAIILAFRQEGKGGSLHGQIEAFRATLLKEMTTEQFADMYAQTICYGMFSARVNVPDREAAQFTRQHAAYDLPATNPFLRQVFGYIAGPDLDDSIVWAVDLLAEILRRCDMGAILKDFGKATRQEDPVVHFYETFLAAYDPRLRESRGVYYTPEPVVSYIVRSIDAILKRDFECPKGLADNSMVSAEFTDANGASERRVHRVQILDPATGTGTFLYEMVQHIYDSLGANKGMWGGDKGYVSQHLLPRLHGFELMMAPYAVAHLKLGWLLKETGYHFPKNERLGVYLTNTLEEAEIRAGQQLLFATEIAKEANAASRVKTETPIMVVMGNPPYSGLSVNMTKWTNDLLKQPLDTPGRAQGYYEVDGRPLGEKKVWLQDDYVKFIRFAQYRIELTGYGVLGFITNHGYLDNPTFRGMRQSLMQTFDRIYILDLHGNTKKKEAAPDGSNDQNVFDIQQGVAIGIFVKHKKTRKKAPAKVVHADLWGTRDAKYKALLRLDIDNVKWTRAKPNSPHYFFVPKNEALREEYESWLTVSSVFSENVAGVITARDSFAIDFEDNALLSRISDLRNVRISDDEIREKYFRGKGSPKYLPGDTRGWKLSNARTRVQADSDWKNRMRDIAYRPFDTRRIYYVPWIVDWPRTDIMRHMLSGENLGLSTTRSVEIGRGWEHIFCSREIVDHHSVSLKEVNYLFPLYLYLNSKEEANDIEEYCVAEEAESYGIRRKPNLSPAFIEALGAGLKLGFVADGRGDLKKTFGPEDVFHYIYAVFHSPGYRERYAEFLKTDFPRVPLTGDRKLFAKLCGLGAELVGLHLLEAVPAARTGYPQEGSHRVDKPRYTPPTDRAPGRVYINDTQYFEPVAPAVWEFHVGGYQVCEKWLKDRNGRTLTFEDIARYQQIAEAIAQSQRLMAEIDQAIPGWPLP